MWNNNSNELIKKGVVPMPIRQERPRKMADSQTSTKRSKKEFGLRLVGIIIMIVLVLAMLSWTVKIFFFK